MIKSISIHKEGRKGWVAYVVSEIGAQSQTVVKEFRRDTLIGLLLEIGAEINQSSRTSA